MDCLFSRFSFDCYGLRTQETLIAGGAVHPSIDRALEDECGCRGIEVPQVVDLMYMHVVEPCLQPFHP